MIRVQNRKNVIIIDLDERYSIMKHKELTLWWLQHYRFGRDYMYEEIYADESLLKVYNKYKEVK